PPRHPWRRLSSLSGRKRLHVCSSCRSRENPRGIRSDDPSTSISAEDPINRAVERCHVRSSATLFPSIHFPGTAGAKGPARVLVLVPGLVPERAPGLAQALVLVLVLVLGPV